MFNPPDPKRILYRFFRNNISPLALSDRRLGYCAHRVLLTQLPMDDALHPISPDLTDRMENTSRPPATLPMLLSRFAVRTHGFEMAQRLAAVVAKLFDSVTFVGRRKSSMHY